MATAKAHLQLHAVTLLSWIGAHIEPEAGHATHSGQNSVHDKELHFTSNGVDLGTMQSV